MERPGAKRCATDARATSALPEQVAALGLKISQTLVHGDQDDPTAVWIGTRIAELMHNAEHAPTADARASAARDCQDLVLAAWQRRRSWPQGWPPTSVAVVSAALAPGKSPALRLGSGEPGPGWSGRLREVLASIERERQVWTLLALREIDGDEVQTWLEATASTVASANLDNLLQVPTTGPPDLTEAALVEEAEEIEMLRVLAEQALVADELLQRLLVRPRRHEPPTVPADPAAVTTFAVKELRRLLKRRIELLRQSPSG